jgi:alpha-galactosidase
VRAGFDAVRRGAGDATFLLACGAPLAPVVGLVDGARIGPDVAPRWVQSREQMLVPAYGDCEPATRIGSSGGMALVSDDLALIDGMARALFDEVIALGRASDDAARAGRPARCPDLLDHPIPTRLDAVGRTLVVDPATGETVATPAHSH